MLMKSQGLSVIRDKNGWSVRLDGVDVVSFVGPHAQQWAFREREELAELLNARADAASSTVLAERMRLRSRRSVHRPRRSADRAGWPRDMEASTRHLRRRARKPCEPDALHHVLKPLSISRSQ